MTTVTQDVEVLQALKARFDSSVEKSREGPKKKNPQTGRWEPTHFTYIPTICVSERLDDVLGLNWTWAVVDTKILTVKKEVKDKVDAGNGQYTYVPRESQVEQVAILGRLTIILPSGKEIYRDAWGGSDLDKGSQAGDSFKIADSNAFKKAAYKFGIGSYLGLDGLEDQEPVVAPVAQNPFSQSQVRAPARKQANNPPASAPAQQVGTAEFNPFRR